MYGNFMMLHPHEHSWDLYFLKNGESQSERVMVLLPSELKCPIFRVSELHSLWSPWLHVLCYLSFIAIAGEN